MKIEFIKDIDMLHAVVGGAKLVVTDKNVKSLYGELLNTAYAMPAGEKTKNFDALSQILNVMSEQKLVRGDSVCVVGGGVVGDVAGLAAALYMRGIEYTFVPTTLLAVVDSSIGGKTAVNFDGVKNLVGAFYPPSAVYVCFDFLQTLGRRERLCGAGEMIKTCALTAGTYGLLKDNFDALTGFVNGERFDDGKFYALVRACIDVKREVTERDPKEKSLRKILNVGHTVGHALESVNDYDKSHGEYVLMGMLVECAMLEEFVEPSFYVEFTGLVKKFVAPPKTSSGAVLSAAKRDKKNTENGITVMLPVNAGDICEVRLCADEFKIRYDRAVKELRRCAE